MRVIAGTARRLPLKTVPGLDTRPTTDRTKETLFNIIASSIADCRFLDLFAGSGAIGIEALSRGAAHCIFVEENRKALECIKENLAFTKLDTHAQVLGMDVGEALSQLEGLPPFDCIFVDPPYEKGLEETVLAACAGASFISEDTLLIIEASFHTDFQYSENFGFEVIKEKKYKTNKHVFVKKR